jgi:hypothetical protein
MMVASVTLADEKRSEIFRLMMDVIFEGNIKVRT